MVRKTLFRTIPIGIGAMAMGFCSEEETLVLTLNILMGQWEFIAREQGGDVQVEKLPRGESGASGDSD